MVESLLRKAPEAEGVLGCRSSHFLHQLLSLSSGRSTLDKDDSQIRTLEVLVPSGSQQVPISQESRLVSLLWSGTLGRLVRAEHMK